MSGGGFFFPGLNFFTASPFQRGEQEDFCESFGQKAVEEK
jgi:hypothetical protein